MKLFIKTERFKAKTLLLPLQDKEKYIHAHKIWVNQLKDKGFKISSGYLIDKDGRPGGGGLMMLEAITFQQAKSIILKDPIIMAGLVNWELNEWIYASGSLINLII